MYLTNSYEYTQMLPTSNVLTGKRVAMLVSNSCVSDARVIKMAEAVANMGAEVKVFGVYKNSEMVPAYEVIGGVVYQRNLWVPMSRIKEHIKKVPKKLSVKIQKVAFKFSKYEEFKNLLFEDVIDFNPDVVHAHDLITLPLGEAIAKESGAKLIYDAHEYEIHRNPPLPIYMKKYVQYIESRGIATANQCITCGQMIGDELVELYGIKHMEIVYNSPRISPLKGYDIKQHLRLGDDTSLVVYVGKVAEGRGIEEIVEILVHLPSVHYACIGPCDDKTKAKILALVEKRGVTTRFHLVPPVHFDNVVSFIRTADLGIISVMPVTRSYYYAMPNKLFEMAFARVPILINDLAEAAPIVKQYKLGKVYDSANPSNLTYLINYMLKHKKSYTANNDLFEDFWNKYSWQTQIDKLRIIYTRLLA